MAFSQPIIWILGTLLLLSSLVVVAASKPVHSSIAFLFCLLTLAALYLELSAQFIAVMQVLVYAGAILVLFMFVIMLFQDAHHQIAQVPPKSYLPLLFAAAVAFFTALFFWGRHFIGLPSGATKLPKGYGTVEALGEALYVDFFFPFEAVILLFLIAIVGAFYIAKKEK